MKLLIIIPAYNEAENIARVVEELKETVPQYDYVVINDGSRDETAAAAGERLLQNEQVAAYLRERLREMPRQDEVLRGIMDIAFADAEGDARVRLRALELLGRHLGTFRAPKDELDRQEQEARIARLRAGTDGGGGGGTLRVVFEHTDGAEE